MINLPGNPHDKTDAEYYERFKAALLGNEGALISDGQTDPQFIINRRRAMSEHVGERHGHWLKRDVHLTKGKGIQDLGTVAWYTTRIKFIPPLEIEAVQGMATRFGQEYDLQDVPNPLYRPDAGTEGLPIERKPSLNGIVARVADGHQARPGEFDIEIMAPEFDKVKANIHIGKARPV